MRIFATAGDNGCRFGHHCRRQTSPNSIKQEASLNKLISTLFMESIKLLQRRPWNEHAQGRPPLRRHGFIKSTPLGGRAAPTPWWCCLSCCLCFLCGFWLVTRQSYLSYVHFRGVTKWTTQACTIPPAHHPARHVQGYLRCHWRMPPSGNYSPRIPLADAMVTDFWPKKSVMALWNCFSKLV